MNKQVIIAAIGDCRAMIEKGLGPNQNCTRRDLIERGAFGLHIIETMLSEPMAEVNVISFGFGDMEGPEPGEITSPGSLRTILDKFAQNAAKQMGQAERPAKCPRCKNEEISPGDKFCKICGMALMMAGKVTE